MWPECAQACPSEGLYLKTPWEDRGIWWAERHRSGPCRFSLQRAIRVRSHSMETMVSSQKKQHSGGIPGSLSGGISHNSMEVTKTTFSVSASGPGAAHGSRGGCLFWPPLPAPGLRRRVCSPRLGPGVQSRDWGDRGSLGVTLGPPCDSQSLSQALLQLAQTRSLPIVLFWEFP